MITLDNISFSYGKKAVVNNISAEFDKGMLYGIIGPNGSGKTTLLRLICGLLNTNSGEIAIDGSPVFSTKRKELARQITMMPQFRPIPDMTVYDFIACGRFPFSNSLGKLTEADREIISSALETTGTSEFKNRFLNTLSGGERQKVYLAMALSQNTDYILLDEPSSYLDIKNSISFMETLLTLKNGGKCIISVFHDISSAFKCCDKILVISNGSCIFGGTPESLVKSDITEKVFGVKCITIEKNGTIHYLFEKN